jgi:hypothetical protein
MLDHRRAFTRTIHSLRNRQPLQQIVGGGFEHFESGHAARPWLSLVLRLLRFAAVGRRVLVVDVMGGPQSWPQQSTKRKHTKAAEKKYEPAEATETFAMISYSVMGNKELALLSDAQRTELRAANSITRARALEKFHADIGF